jgi:hypothetical protein
LIYTFTFNSLTFITLDILPLQKKKFGVKLTNSRDGRKLQFYTFSEEWSKYLLDTCKSTHVFNVGKQKELAELKHLEAEDRKHSSKESYIYGGGDDERDTATSRTSMDRGSSGLGASSGRGTNRTSIHSNASSNTTSGIVSDRMHTSLDESGEKQWKRGGENVHGMIIVGYDWRQLKLEDFSSILV